MAAVIRTLVVAAIATLAVLSVTAQEGLRLALVDRSGTVTGLGTLPPSAYAPRISPDGRQVAYDAEGATWIANLGKVGTPRRLATGLYPLWSGDGTRVLFIVGPQERQQLFWQAADGSGAPELLVDNARAPESWSTAAQVLTYITLKGGSDYDISVYPLRDRTPRALAALPNSNQSGSRVSPDGRWLAYESNDSGTWEVYVEPVPRPGTRLQVTKGGGRRPLWSRDGTELFYDREDATLYMVPFRTEPRVGVGTAVTLPIKGFVQGGARRQYDLMPDGRFLMMFR